MGSARFRLKLNQDSVGDNCVLDKELKLPINSAMSVKMGSLNTAADPITRLLRTKHSLFSFIIAMFLVVATQSVSANNDANDTLTLNDDSISQNLARFLQVHEDKSNELSIHELISNRSSFGFSPVDSSVINYGYTASAYWINFKINFQTAHKENWYLRLPDPLMDVAELYVIDSTGKVTTQIAGDTKPHSNRDVQSRFPVFHLDGFPNETINVYLKIKSQDPIQVALSIHSQKSYSEESFKEVLVLGAYYGIIAVMLFYNLFIF